MILETALAAGAAVGVSAWAVRGKSSNLLVPSEWEGTGTRPSVAFTFDDGPSEHTGELLDVLGERNVRATFFQCGRNAARLPDVARRVRDAGHEIGNHTENHSPLYFRSPGFILREIEEAQVSLEQATGARPKLFRPPFGVRWIGLRGALEAAGLRNVMWSCIGSDWRLSSDLIFQKLLNNARAGAIFCLHDGRETRPDPNVRPMIEAVRRLIPEMASRGFDFETTSEILCPNPPSRPI